MGSVQDAASRLLEPLTFPISSRVAPNRFLKAAMSERLATWDDNDVSKRGIPTPAYINAYKTWGEGGWGQILTGNIMIEPDHLEAARNAIIPRDAPFSGPRFEGFKAAAAAGKARGSLMVGQVSHPGRQAPYEVQPNPVSASDVQLVSEMGRYGKPRAATQEDVDGVVAGFAHAAEFLERAGFDGMQVHGAHGYLVAQFLSPTTNRRADRYGGGVANRARLAAEIARAVRRRVSRDFVVGIKLNSVEFQAGGITGDDAVRLCLELQGAGFDYFELSGGTYEKLAFTHRRESTRRREAFFLEFAESLAAARKNDGSEPRVYITGGFKTAKGMADALDVVDGVGVGKPACADPAIARKLAAGTAQGVLPTSIPEDQYFAALRCAMLQIGQIGRGEEPMDLTVPAVWQKVMAEFAAAARAKAEAAAA